MCRREKEERENGSDTIVEQKLVKHFLKLKKDMKIQFCKALLLPKIMNSKNITSRHTVLKTMKKIKEEKILKAARVKKKTHIEFSDFQ